MAFAKVIGYNSDGATSYICSDLLNCSQTSFLQLTQHVFQWQVVLDFELSSIVHIRKMVDMFISWIILNAVTIPETVDEREEIWFFSAAKIQ